ncbi:hypothetical protein [Burkholderia phage vB_BpP_HN05]
MAETYSFGKAAGAIRDALMDKLREPEERRWQLQIDKLVDTNFACDPSNSMKGFMYSGQRYIHSQARTKYKSYPMLWHTLWGEMDAILLDQSMHDLKFSQVGQMIYRLLYECNDRIEARNNLPECLVQLLNEDLRNTPRKFAEGYILREGCDWRAQKQFEELLPTMEAMVVARMIM